MEKGKLSLDARSDFASQGSIGIEVTRDRITPSCLRAWGPRVLSSPAPLCLNLLPTALL